MTPLEQIQRKYAECPQERSFEYYLNWHLEHGFVFSTPDFFIMGRPMQREIMRDDVALEAHTDADTWYVHAMAGDIRKAWSVLPWELPYIAFERFRDGKRELQIVKLDRLRSLSDALCFTTIPLDSRNMDFRC